MWCGLSVITTLFGPHPVYSAPMAKRKTTLDRTRRADADAPAHSTPDAARPAPGRPSALVDTRVIDLVSIDPPFNSNRNDEVFRGVAKETRVARGRGRAGRRSGPHRQRS
ncbi:MAG: hypothetical protein AMXMBFR77_17660 [Phycisphaerales bacterium]|nr:MAG: hypothetical protein BroJett004_17720 [Planctomycetota bacterium]